MNIIVEVESAEKLTPEEIGRLIDEVNSGG